jgi:hypothetical protein
MMAVATLALSACATPEPQQTSAAPVYEPVRSTGYVTIHTIPEGAMLLVNTAGSFGMPLAYLANGYSPLTFPVPLADGGLSTDLVIEATPTSPGQRSQRAYISESQGVGVYTISMYNTGPGANL